MGRRYIVAVKNGESWFGLGKGGGREADFSTALLAKSASSFRSK
jgi:hypothetical protein